MPGIEQQQENNDRHNYIEIFREYNALCERFEAEPLYRSDTDNGLYLDDNGKLLVGIFAKDVAEQTAALETIENLPHISPSSFVMREQRGKKGEHSLPQSVSVRWYSDQKEQAKTLKHSPATEREMIRESMEEVAILPPPSIERDSNHER